MIRVNDVIKKEQKNFWSNCLFTPTDGMEDPWGKRILDRMSKDKSIQSIRIWAMLEDIVYVDENGQLAYDFRLTDLRIDYMLEKGFEVIIAYGMMPPCIASDRGATISMTKNKTRYKGKMINTSEPVDYDLWEEVCYQYTKHLVDRYGIEEVSKWYLLCFNEPDSSFFVPRTSPEFKIEKYAKLYTSFVKGVTRVSDKLRMGGPVLAHGELFFEYFLNFINETGTRLDFISVHNYAGCGFDSLNDGSKTINVNHWLDKLRAYMRIIEKCGFMDTELVVDEWGMAAGGYLNVENCPAFLARDTEVFASYYVKLIQRVIAEGFKFSKLLICLSGQHEMVTEFSGFRNFFSLNFAPKPIYNAHILSSRLYEGLTDVQHSIPNLYVIPTRNENGDYAVLMTYSDDEFSPELPEITEELVFDRDVSGKTATIYCIDANTANAYRLYEKLGKPEPVSDEQIKMLKEAGTIKPVAQFPASEKINLTLRPNCVYFVQIN